jgi:molybdopterin synthase sulfur carrier subunit
MKITVEVYGYLADVAGVKKQTIEIAGPTVRALLAEMSRTWSPRFMRIVLDENGDLTAQVSIFVNSITINDQQGLETRLQDGDQVVFMQPMEGGSLGILSFPRRRESSPPQTVSSLLTLDSGSWAGMTFSFLVRRGMTDCGTAAFVRAQ